MDEVFGLFPIPVMRVRPALEPDVVKGLVEHFESRAEFTNKASTELTHSAILQPGDTPLLVTAATAIVPKLEEFGRLLFGERLGWAIKEMWVNVMHAGGTQNTHNHANSFISGVVYLTSIHDDARTVFLRAQGTPEFAFRNDHDGVESSPYNEPKWVGPSPQPGEMVLFPSYLLHCVPPNPDGRRITLSFNAIPTRLSHWGYTVSFGG
jgi:hypothetical protein